jgi:hypothetical protein
MMLPGSTTRGVVFSLTLLLPAGATLAKAQGAQAPDAASLVVESTVLPKAMPRHLYRFQFRALNGTPPLKWTVVDGDMAAGVKLSPDGLLAGSPLVAGTFRFTVSVTDGSTSPQTATRQMILRVLKPLSLEWETYPKVSGNRIDGRVQVSNGTDDDFDFTLIVLAVAENGRATAIGYQRFSLNAGVDSFEIPFGETLPRGGYTVHVDAVAEVAEKEAIYRVRLQTKEALQVMVGP